MEKNEKREEEKALAESTFPHSSLLYIKDVMYRIVEAHLLGLIAASLLTNLI
jgi:hypothetical protein